MKSINPSAKSHDLIDKMLVGLIQELQNDYVENAIPYRPFFKRITGHTNAAILLQQIWYWFQKVGYQPFYKFTSPCDHELYRPGDSWTEELQFSEAEYSTAMKYIATKVTKGTSKTEAYEKSIIVYWTDQNRVSYFDVNMLNLAKAIFGVLASDPAILRNPFITLI